jgi:phage tail-like protein
MPMNADLILGFRFGVYFFADGNENQLDIRFQKVSGISAELQLDTYAEGGRNLYTHRLPQSLVYNNLVLERGMLVGSPLNEDFSTTMTSFKFRPCKLLVSLLNEEGKAIMGWMFIKAFPVKWSSSTLNAAEPSLLIETIEVAYARMQQLRG